MDVMPAICPKAAATASSAAACSAASLAWAAEGGLALMRTVNDTVRAA